MISFIAVFVGGGLGSCLRYLLKIFADKNIRSDFPCATFVANIAGCLLIGIVMALFQHKFKAVPEHIRLFLTVGILGGFTTFSTFGFEAVELMRKGSAEMSLIYVFASVIIGLAAVFIGFSLIKPA